MPIVVKSSLAVTGLILCLVYTVFLVGQLAGVIEFGLLTSPPALIGIFALALGLIIGGRKLVKSKIDSAGRAASYHKFE